jgi:hypothetical protein
MRRSEEDQDRSHQPESKRFERITAVATVFIGLFGLIAAIFSGLFTFQQACVSQDQEYRTLRAYIVVNTPTKMTFSADAMPEIIIDAESKGATPVYRMRPFYAASVGPRETLIRMIWEPEMTVSCTQDAEDDAVGDTFSDHKPKAATLDKKAFSEVFVRGVAPGCRIA